MPVHNAAPFLNVSISSVVNQTFRDFELVILDDASVDESPQLLRQWEQKDRRIRVYRSQQQLGLAGSSNLVVKKTRSPIIARMDADDVSHPHRLARQLEVMKRADDVVAVGTLFDGIDRNGQIVRPRDRWRLLRPSQYIPFPHGSAMFRRAAFDAVGGYEELICGEDQNFFLKLATTGRVVTLPAVLYHFRYHATNTTLFADGSAFDVANASRRHGDELTTLYLRAAMRLWSGHSPGVLRAMLAKGVVHGDSRSAAMLAWALVGSLSPAMLRFSMRLLIRARDTLAGLAIVDGQAYDWRHKSPTQHISSWHYQAPVSDLRLADTSE